MNNLDKQYQELLQDILDNGIKKEDRTGTGTLSVFGRQIRHKMSDGFPILTTKKVYWKGVVAELLWFLRGDTNIKFLHDNDVHIWDGDYNKSGRTDGELGPIYGAQWRSWGGFYKVPTGWNHGMETEFKNVPKHDQIANIISELKTNPDSRRLIVNSWNVSDLNQMILPPCHYSWQIYTRPTTREEKITNPGKYRAISLMFNMRSNDVPLGLPFNLASYGLLLEILAKEVNMVPDELIASLGDAHIYLNQIDGVKEQLTRQSYPLPKLVINDEFWNPDASLIEQINYIKISDFEIRDYQSHPTIKIPLSN